MRNQLWQGGTSVLSVLLVLCVSCSGSLSAIAADDCTAMGRLVFAANASGNWDLFASTPCGSPVVQLTQSAVDELSPAISPDGSRLAYSTSDGALWTMVLANRKVSKVPLG